jgi:hypothetical protein
MRISALQAESLVHENVIVKNSVMVQDKSQVFSIEAGFILRGAVEAYSWHEADGNSLKM